MTLGSKLDLENGHGWRLSWMHAYLFDAKYIYIYIFWIFFDNFGIYIAITTQLYLANFEGNVFNFISDHSKTTIL